MLKAIRATLRILTVLFFLLGAAVVATGVYCYRYQDQIIKRLLDQAQKRLGYSIQMSSIQLTALKSFPNIALACHDVVVKDRLEIATDLVAVRKIYCAFDIWQFMRGQYVLAHLYLEHGKLYLRPDLKWPPDREQGVRKRGKSEVPLVIKLPKIHLKDIDIAYGSKQQYCKISAEQAQASLRWDHVTLEAGLRGKTVLRNIQLKDVSFAQDLPLSLNAALRYDQQEQTWTLRSMQLKHGNAQVDAQGHWESGTASSVVLAIRGQKVSPQLLLRCFSQQYYQKSKSYNLRGGLAFNLHLHKKASEWLGLRGDFLLRDGTMTVGQSTTPMEISQLSGHLSIPNVQDLKTATLNIDQLAGRLASSKLEGSLALRDFHSLHLQCIAKAKLDLASLSSLFVHSSISDASGILDWDGKFETNLQQLMLGNYASDNMLLSGELQTQEMQCKLGPSQLPCKYLMGKLVFKDDALSMQNFSGNIGPGSFVLAGTVHNVLPYLLFDAPKIWGDAQLYMDYLDLDVLLRSKRTSAVPTSVIPAKFTIPPQWALNLDCDIQQLHYSRFRGKNVRGKIKIEDQKLIAEKLQLGASGGKVFLNGAVDTSTDDLNIHTVAKLQGVRIADLFYTFGNFRQNFLMDSHLSGKVFSDVDLTMQTDRRGKMRWEALHATINFRMIDVGLHDFSPLQQLAKYIDKERLTNLRFSELKNHILVKDKTIYIPPMEVQANPTRIRLSGTHTFDGKIDYSFCVPFAVLQQKRGEMIPEADTEAAGLHLFFKLKGDIDHYKISYDTEASRKSIAKAIKTQGNVLKALIQSIFRKSKQLQELAPDDYFEFDE